MITIKLIKFTIKVVLYTGIAAAVFLGYDFYSSYKESLAAGRPKELAAFEAGKHTYERISAWVGRAQKWQEQTTVKAEEIQKDERQ